MNTKRTSAVERFWKKVRKTVFYSAKPDCWLWTGATNSRGYGQIMDDAQKTVYVHRFSFELHNGKIPAGQYVCHSCDIPNCVNPKHLFLGTQSDNMADCSNKGRARGKVQIGENHPAAKLDEKTVKMIKFMDFKYGDKRRLAKQLGVTASLICAIKNNKAWRHL